MAQNFRVLEMFNLFTNYFQLLSEDTTRLAWGNAVSRFPGWKGTAS